MVETIQLSKKHFSEKIEKDQALHHFFKSTLRGYFEELQHLKNSWYNETAIQNEVFALIERSHVGLFNNAVVRKFPTASVLQEYSVPIDGAYGRADYLVKKFIADREINILFEAKQREFDGKEYNLQQTAQFLAPFIEQADKYYQAEKNYFRGETYLASLVFEWIRNKKRLDQVLNWSNKEDGVTDFYCVCHNSEAGVMVYGNIIKQE